MPCIGFRGVMVPIEGRSSILGDVALEERSDMQVDDEKLAKVGNSLSELVQIADHFIELFVDAKTHLPKRTESYTKRDTDNDYILRTIKTVKTIKDEELVSLIEKAGF